MMAAGGAIVPPAASSRHASVVPLHDHMLGARAVAVLDVDIADMAYAPARPRRDLRHVAGRTALDPAGFLRRASRPLRRATRSNKSRCRATSTRPRRLPCPCRRRRPCCRSSPCSRCRASGSGRPLAARGRRCRAPACRARSAASRSAFSRQSSGVSGRCATCAAWVAASGMSPAAGVFTGLFSICSRCCSGVGFDSAFCIAPPCPAGARRHQLPPPVRESLQRSLQIFHGLGRRARLRAHVPARHGTLHTEGAPTRNRRDVRPTRQTRVSRRSRRPARKPRPACSRRCRRCCRPPRCSAYPTARWTVRPTCRPWSFDSELAPPLSLFFWQPAPAARPAIRRPAKTARDTCRSEYRCMTPPLMSMWMEHAGAQFACRAGPSQPPRFHSFFK